MNDINLKSIEDLFYEKIMLYGDLRNCFKKERDALIKIDVDILWKISEEKERLSEKIQSVRKEIISIASPEKCLEPINLDQVMSLIPGYKKAKFHRLYLALTKLKGEIALLRKDNMLFIDDSLEFLDDMISIITGKTESEITYNNNRRVGNSSAQILLNSEV